MFRYRCPEGERELRCLTLSDRQIRHGKNLASSQRILDETHRSGLTRRWFSRAMGLVFPVFRIWKRRPNSGLSNFDFGREMEVGKSRMEDRGWRIEVGGGCPCLGAYVSRTRWHNTSCGLKSTQRKFIPASRRSGGLAPGDVEIRAQLQQLRENLEDY